MAAKKDFKAGGLVAERFLSSGAVETRTAAAPADGKKAGGRGRKGGGVSPKPDGYAVRYSEKLTRRVQVVLPPSLYADAKARASALGLSFNAFIVQMLASGAAADG